jgi:hypothetical protein
MSSSGGSISAFIGSKWAVIAAVAAIAGGVVVVPAVSGGGSSSLTCPAYPSFPDASCTGWAHTGVTLTTVNVGDSGPGWSAESVGGNPVFYVRTNGAVIDSLNIPMTVKVNANNVTIKRSRIAAAGYYTVNVSDPPTYYDGLTLQDVEVDGLGDTSTPGIAVMGSGGATFDRVDFHGFLSSGPRLASGATLKDSYIHDFVCVVPEHSAGTSANDGGTNITILHNNVDINTGAAGCATAAIELAEDFGTYNGALIKNNLMNGGSYCLYAAQTLTSSNVLVEDNHFGRKYFANCGSNGAAAQIAAGTRGNTFSGNVWDDTGLPVTP